MKAVILAGSDIRVTDALRERVSDADIVVAADSGLHHAALLGLTPTLVVGDFDSVSAEVLGRYENLAEQRHPPEKDRLDLELAFAEVDERGADEVVVVGVLGGRLDQTLAAVVIAARRAREGRTTVLDDGYRQVYLLVGEEGLELPLPPDTLFSLIALEHNTTVSIQGAKYDLDPTALPFGVGLGVSNRVATPPLGLRSHGGLVAVIVEHDVD
ncbi:MAG: thiamine diphosphokinase [Trueperaceae bacterium]|nr:thiamine diphosphokinase [Trueperaceae bacterium]